MFGSVPLIQSVCCLLVANFMFKQYIFYAFTKVMEIIRCFKWKKLIFKLIYP